MGLGPLFKSSQPAQLTESETEYVVNCIKHVFPQHLLLQFDCTNTLNDQHLEDVSVQLEVPDGYTVERTIPCPMLEYNSGNGVVYVILATPPDMSDCSYIWATSGWADSSWTILLNFL